MTAACLTLTREKRDLRTEGHLLPATVKRAIFTVLCGTLLVLFASPAWADPCSTPTIGPAVNTSNFPNTTPTCGVVITIEAGSTSGNIIATISGSGLPYDYQDDQLVGIQNLSTSVTVGAIVLSGTPAQDPFGFDGDGPCFYNSLDCFTNKATFPPAMKARTTYSSASVRTPRPGRSCSRPQSRRVGAHGSLWKAFRPFSRRSGRTRRSPRARQPHSHLAHLPVAAV